MLAMGVMGMGVVVGAVEVSFPLSLSFDLVVAAAPGRALARLSGRSLAPPPRPSSACRRRRARNSSSPPRPGVEGLPAHHRTAIGMKAWSLPHSFGALAVIDAFARGLEPGLVEAAGMASI